MPWLSAFFLFLLSLLIGWIPVLGPLALGVLAARAEPGSRALLAVLPALGAQTLGLLATRAVVGAVQDRHLDGWVWTAVQGQLTSRGQGGSSTVDSGTDRPSRHVVTTQRGALRTVS